MDLPLSIFAFFIDALPAKKFIPVSFHNIHEVDNFFALLAMAFPIA